MLKKNHLETAKSQINALSRTTILTQGNYVIHFQYLASRPITLN